MSKVYPLQDMHVGAPHGGVHLKAVIGWDEDHPFVQEHRSLFTEPEEDPKDAEIAALKEQLAALRPKRGAA